MIVAFAGGVGGARLAQGLDTVLGHNQLTIVVNTGDDFEHLGLHISPDLDTVMYTLAGLNDTQQGWGIAGETWHFMHALEQLGGPTWFRLGDRDLATHVERTRRLRAGEPLSSITRDLCARLGVRSAVLPMSDDPVRTIVHTDAGPLEFQEYFVRQRAQPQVMQLEFSGAPQARMPATLRAAFDSSAFDAIVICPSNPYLSIAPIFAIPGVRTFLENRRVPAIAVSPIVGGNAIKGPAAKIMRELGREASSLTVAHCYRGLIDMLVIDDVDQHLCKGIEALGIRPAVAQTVMCDRQGSNALAQTLLELASSIRVSLPAQFAQ